MENISVYVRLKPIKNKKDNNLNYDSKSITNIKTNECFLFDSVIPPNMSNKEIFDSLIRQKLNCLLKGINVSIFAYGQTSTGKTFTMRGDQRINEGLIPLSIKEIFNNLSNNNTNISKYILKVSYAEIYNETVNDLIDSSKKNLDIRESIDKEVIVNNLSEITVTNVDKAIHLLNKGESNRIIAETKLNEKSSRSHTIFKINIEFYSKDKNINKEKKFSSQLCLVDLAGSENVSKAKCEGLRIKEGGNINKSLLALSNVINKLSQNNKTFINYRDSKLTRLLQTALEGNSKTSIICTIVDDDGHYSETLNTLHFGLKAKNIKTTVKINEIINNKGKIAIENEALRKKIKLLEKIINEKKLSLDKNPDNKQSNKTYSLLSSGNKGNNDDYNNEQISNLEREVSMLKRYLMSNEEICSELNSFNDDYKSVKSGNNCYNSILNINNNFSAYKPSLNNRINCLSAVRGQESGLKNPFFNSPFRQNQVGQTDMNINLNSSFIESLNNQINKNNVRRKLCMTEMRPTYVNKNLFHSTIRKPSSLNTFFGAGNNFYISSPEHNNNYDLSNSGKDYLLKENEELKKNIYELKKTYYEVVQSKEQQIILLNQNHDITLENCEKLIKEAEASYTNLKTEYDQIIEKIKLKDNELINLKEKTTNQGNSINYYKNELEKAKDINFIEEMESKYNSLLEENIKLKEIGKEETLKLKEENELLKNNIDIINNKYQKKCEELTNNQIIIDEAKKTHEKELQKIKNEIKNNNFNFLAGKIDNAKKSKMNKNDNNKYNLNNCRIKEYEEKISKLIEENNKYKNNLEKIEKIQIVEYQKLLDDSFAKISELNKELNNTKDKNKYLEKALNMIEKTSKKNIKDNDSYISKFEEINFNEKKPLSNEEENKIISNNSDNILHKNISNLESQNFLNKKRKNISTNCKNDSSTKNKNLEKESCNNNKENNNNILNNEFSAFEI